MIQVQEYVTGQYKVQGEVISKYTHQLHVTDDRVGIFNTGTSNYVSEFGLVPFNEWLDPTGTPYATLEALITDLNTFFF